MWRSNSSIGVSSNSIGAMLGVESCHFPCDERSISCCKTNITYVTSVLAARSDARAARGTGRVAGRLSNGRSAGTNRLVDFNRFLAPPRTSRQGFHILGRHQLVRRGLFQIMESNGRLSMAQRLAVRRRGKLGAHRRATGSGNGRWRRQAALSLWLSSRDQFAGRCLLQINKSNGSALGSGRLARWRHGIDLCVGYCAAGSRGPFRRLRRCFNSVVTDH